MNNDRFDYLEFDDSRPWLTQQPKVETRETKPSPLEAPVKTFEVLDIIGRQGCQPGEFNAPWGTTLDAYANLYVADSYNNRIQKFDGTGKFVLAIGTRGEQFGQFRNPQGVAVDRELNIYVVEAGNHRVQKFNQQGQFVLSFGKLGNLPGEFNSPSGITTDSTGNIYVADTNNNRIQKFSRLGYLLMVIGPGGRDRIRMNKPMDAQTRFFNNIMLPYQYEFNRPQGVAISNEDNLYVADTFNHRIIKFQIQEQVATEKQETRQQRPWSIWTRRIWRPWLFPLPLPDEEPFPTETLSETQEIERRTLKVEVQIFGSQGNSLGQLNQPQDLALDAEGNIYVVEMGTHRMQKFDPQGKSILAIGFEGIGLGEFEIPGGVTVDSEGAIYIADTLNHRIQKIRVRE